jgi:hypothetical protein
VPFAFCLERLLFAYANIYKRIIAFTAILVAHPRYLPCIRLSAAYSPMVVILAFSSWAFPRRDADHFFRFEQEMADLQSRARMVHVEISR